MSKDAQIPTRCALFVGGRTFAFAGARLALLQHFVGCGWRTVVAARADATARRLQSASVEVYDTPFAPHGFSPRSDVQAWRSLRRLFKQTRPALIHLHHAKPTVLAALPARRTGAFVAGTVTGLGTLSHRSGLFSAAATRAIHRSMAACHQVVFQNPDDRNQYIDRRIVSAAQSALIIGSGVDTDRFRPRRPDPNGTVRRVLMPARLLWQKGVREYVEAAASCKQEFPRVQFQLAGEWPETHPDAVPRSWLTPHLRSGVVEYLGCLPDMHRTLADVDLVVLPSHREGAPRVLMESAACGVPAVTVDSPGCKEIVAHGRTGLIAPARDPAALSGCILRLLRDRELRLAMSGDAREFALERFDQWSIAAAFVGLYRQLGLPISELAPTAVGCRAAAA